MKGKRLKWTDEEIKMLKVLFCYKLLNLPFFCYNQKLILLCSKIDLSLSLLFRRAENLDLGVKVNYHTYCYYTLDERIY